MDKNWYNKLLFGPNDVVGGSNTCPSSTYLWNSQCCCGSGCCWDQCGSNDPNCIEDVPDSKWVFNDNLGYYQAYKYEGIYDECSGVFLHLFRNNMSSFVEVRSISSLHLF